MIMAGPYVEFPLKGEIRETSKGAITLKPSEDYVIYNILVDSGYRGESFLKCILSRKVLKFLDTKFGHHHGETSV